MKHPERNLTVQRYNVTSTPLQVFADERRWVTYSGAPLPNGKINKAPLSPSTGGNALLDKPGTWGTKEAAERRAKRLAAPGHRPGIGIAMGDLGDGTALLCADLDGCLGQDGEMADWAEPFYRRLDSYSDLSPSDTGVKVFVRVAAADLPALRKAAGMASEGPKSHRRQWKIGDHVGLDLLGSNSYGTLTERPYGTVKPLRLVPLADLLWLVAEADRTLVRPSGAASEGRPAKDRPKDMSGSGVAYRHLQDTMWAGGTDNDARAAIEADQGAAGDWWRRTTEREQDRAVERALKSVDGKRPPSTALFDSCWTAEQLAEIQFEADFAEVVGLPKDNAVALNRRDSDLGTPLMQGNRPIINLHNTILYLGGNVDSVLPDLRHNLMTARDEWRNGLLTDADLSLARTALERLGLSTVGKELVKDAALAVARFRQYHPIREDLLRVQHDGRPRLDSWLVRYAGAKDSPYVRAVGRKWIIAMVARVMRPGCKHDHMPVLIGPQGAGKSSLCRVLAGDAYFSDSLPSLGGRNQEAEKHLLGKWLVEVAEMQAMNKAEHAEIKSFVSGQIDILRRAWDRLDAPYARQCVFVGTTNDDEFLRDPTGGRRFWPVHVGEKIDLEGLAREREQLFAEAVAAYAAGESWWLDPAFEAEHARPVQEAARVTDSWADDIAAWLDKPKADFDESEVQRDSVTLSEVLHGALGMTPAQQTMAHQKRASDILRGLGWIKTHTKKGNRWGRPE